MAQKNKRPRGPSKAASCCSELGELLAPRFFKALADPRRLAIFQMLALDCEPCTVSRVADAMPVDVSVVSRHLSALRDAGIVSAERRGKEVHYSVRYGTLVGSLRKLADAIEACCPADAPSSKGE